jgi:hypothetical protein
LCVRQDAEPRKRKTYAGPIRGTGSRRQRVFTARRNLRKRRKANRWTDEQEADEPDRHIWRDANSVIARN